MTSILPEEILNKLRCKTCKNYLSQNVQNSDGVICGRCPGLNATTSLFGTVAEFCLFPCINRYENCNLLLRYSDVPQHEKNCKGNQYACPMCPVGSYTPNSLLYLVDHYETNHTKYFLLQPKFCVDPSVMSETSYLFIDRNCLFIIEVGCTKDKLFLKAKVAGNVRATRKFKVNGFLHQVDEEVVCEPLQSIEVWENSQLQLNIDAKIDANNIICEFLFEMANQVVPMVAMDLNSIEPANFNLRKLPKLYLDPRHFQGNKNNYKLSPCKSKLLNMNDVNFSLQLKCDVCDTYFWNCHYWKRQAFLGKGGDKIFQDFVLYRNSLQKSNELICSYCIKMLSSEEYEEPWIPVINADIFKLNFYCRYNCGKLFSVFELYSHENKCVFNLEKLTGSQYAKKMYGCPSYEENALFANGNIVRLVFHSTYREGSIYIYVFNDEGYKCKLKIEWFEDCLNGRAIDYDSSKYHIEFRFINYIMRRIDKYVEHFSISINTSTIKQEFIVIIKKIHLTLNVAI